HEVDIHGHRLFVFPEPQRLAELESFKGLFGRKVEYLSGLGRAALAGRLDTERLRALSPEQCLAELKQLAGIGDFGSQLVRLRALSAGDELPTTERRLLAALRDAYGLEREPDMGTLEELAEGWRPYRMWVCVCLRRAGGEGAGMMHSRRAGSRFARRLSEGFGQRDSWRTTSMAPDHSTRPAASSTHIAAAIKDSSTSAPMMHIAAAPASTNEPGSRTQAEYHGGCTASPRSNRRPPAKSNTAAAT